MKKILLFGLAIAVTIFALAACIRFDRENKNVKNNSTNSFDYSRLKTVGDILACDDFENLNESYTDKNYVVAFSVDGAYYRAIAEMPEDVSAAIWKIDLSDKDREKKVRELISPLKVNIEDLSDKILSQKELDKLVGKVGRELFDNGWTYWFYDLETMTTGMNYGAFAYTVKFEYDGKPMENTDDFDFYDKFKDLRVSSVKFDGLGNATDLE